MTAADSIHLGELMIFALGWLAGFAGAFTLERDRAEQRRRTATAIRYNNQGEPNR